MVNNSIYINAGFLGSTWGIVTIIAAVLAIAAVIYLWLRITTKRQRFQKAILALDKEKVAITSLPVGFKLLKLEKIGNSNVVYAEVHQEYKKSYEELVNMLNKEFKNDYAIANRELNDKNYRKLAETIKSIQIKLESYKDKMQQLTGQIDLITKDEDESRIQEAELKSKVRECYEKYQRNHHELEILHEEFTDFFHRIDEKFQTYEDYLQRGSYTDAKEILMMIKDNLEEVDRQLKVAPRYTILVTRDIPQKMNSVIDKYNDMQANGFPLYHILANSIITNLKERLNVIVKRLKAFQYDGINNAIEDMVNDIDKLDKQLENEKDARMAFDNEAEKTYDQAASLERFYIKHIKDSTEVKKVYVVNELQDKLEAKFKVEVQKLSVIRRNLDSLNYGEQPYSLRIGKLNDLIKQVQVVEDCKAASLANIDGMRDNSDYAFNLLDEATYRLKNLELQVRSCHLEKIRQAFSENFESGYSMVEKLAAVIASVPIEIEKVQYYSKELTTLIENLQKETAKMISDATYAEKLIMYANNYRANYSDVARDVSKAELYYYDGKYEEAIQIAKTSLARFPIPSSLERKED